MELRVPLAMSLHPNSKWASLQLSRVSVKGPVKAVKAARSRKRRGQSLQQRKRIIKYVPWAGEAGDVGAWQNQNTADPG